MLVSFVTFKRKLLHKNPKFWYFSAIRFCLTQYRCSLTVWFQLFFKRPRSSTKNIYYFDYSSACFRLHTLSFSKTSLTCDAGLFVTDTPDAFERFVWLATLYIVGKKFSFSLSQRFQIVLLTLLHSRVVLICGSVTRNFVTCLAHASVFVVTGCDNTELLLNVLTFFNINDVMSSFRFKAAIADSCL